MQVVQGEHSPQSAQSARRLVSGLRKRHERRRRLFPRVLLLGVLVGVVASLFRAGVDRAEEIRSDWIAELKPLGLVGFLELAAACAGLAALAVFLVRRFEPNASGSGIPHLKAVLHRLRPISGVRLILVKFFGGLSGIGAGLALGREGPTIQMGGALGRLVTQWFPTSAHERQVMIAAGAGGGLAAAFNAPLAGVIFVLEEIQKNFAPGVFSASFLASVTADAIGRLLLGQTAVFRTSAIAQPPVEAVPLFALLGVVAGLIGVAFNRGLLAGLGLADRIPANWRVPAGAGFGVIVAAIAWSAPGAVGGGGRLVHDAIEGRGLIPLLLATLALRFVLTLGSYSTGAPGGIFAPLLVLGAQAGLVAGLFGAAFAPGIVGEPRAWAVAGMAGLFAATVRAPLTGIVLMLEMTDSYSLMLPLLASSFAAQWTADLLGQPPVYDSLLERELAASSEIERPEGALLLELDVLPEAPFAGMRVADLGLARGVLIVALERKESHHVVTGTTRLHSGDRLTVIVSPEAADSVGMLRVGLGMEESG